MFPKRSQVRPRRPLESTLGSETRPEPILVQKWVQFWSQNWSKICQKSTKNRKNTDSETNLEFDVIFWSIFDQILINFEAKIESNFDQILR